MRGVEVQLEGLVQQPELNGAQGVLLECWCGIWKVQCGKQTVCVEPQNARVPPQSGGGRSRDQAFEKEMQAGSPAMMEEYGQSRLEEYWTRQMGGARHYSGVRWSME